LTLDAALQLARERSPALVAARSRVAEAQARLRGARTLRDNPSIEAAVGRRGTPAAPSDVELAVSQTLELGGRRAARIDAAREAVGGAEAARDHVLGRTLREVTSAFLVGLAAEQRLRLARTAETYAAEVLAVAERRHAAGDVAILDVNLARGALSRARSEAFAAEAGRALALGELKALLAIEAGAPLALAGELRAAPAPDPGALLEASARRPDVRAVESALREASAELRLGGASRWPDVTPAIRYERDEGADVFWAGLTLTLPVWNRGQEVRGLAEARTSKLRAEAEALRRAARTEAQSAYEAHALRLRALAELETTARLLDENETLARRSYEVGQIGLGELLIVRREALDGRLLLLERRLEAAQGEKELLARAGVLR
jgi:cobalt-zinc-cadmium efflux system outer membrane protein